MRRDGGIAGEGKERGGGEFNFPSVGGERLPLLLLLLLAFYSSSRLLRLDPQFQFRQSGRRERKEARTETRPTGLFPGHTQ